MRSALILASGTLAASSLAATMTYRYEGALTAFADPIYAGQPPVTDGSVASVVRFSGTFTVNTLAFFPVTSIDLTLGRYAFASPYATSSSGPGAATIEGYGLTSPQVARPIPDDEYNRIEAEVVVSQTKLAAILAAQPTTASGVELTGSQVLLQLLWRDPNDNPQSLQARGSIDRIESVPEPASSVALGLGVLSVLRRRRKA